MQRGLAALADQVREQLQRFAVHAQAAVLAGAVHRPAQRGGHLLAVGGPLCSHRPQAVGAGEVRGVGEGLKEAVNWIKAAVQSYVGARLLLKVQQ